MERKYEDMRSCWEFGEASECRRGLMLGMGYTEEELNRPLIAVVNSWNEYNPGHVHLNQLAERVKQGIREAGGLPLEVGTTAICDGMVLKDPKYIEIPSRNLIADQVELTVDGNFFDGMVLLSTCDSIVPGHLMGCARLDIPAIVVTGGYMPLGTFRGKEVVHIRAQDKVGAMAEGKIDPDLYNGLIQHSWGICGGCTSMTTANSMCMMAEAMGMTLPGNSSMSAVSSEIRNLSYRAGLRIMEMVRQGITARQIITPESIRNAIAVDMAVAGSSNLILHLPAIAHEAGYDEPWWKVFDEMSNTVPLLSHLMPGGEYSVKDFDLAGTLSIAKTSSKADDAIDQNKFDFDTTYASSAKIYEDFDGSETLENGGGIVEFADDCGEIDIEFGEEALFTVNANGQGDLNLKYNTDYNSDFAAMYDYANIDFLTFPGEPSFNRNGTLYIYADEDTYLYEVTADGAKELDAVWDEDYEAWKLTTRTLTSYAVSDVELDVKTSTDEDTDTDEDTSTDTGSDSSTDTSEKPNPDTGR